MAQIGNTYYSSLPDAVEAAQGGETIELLKDLDISNTDTRWYIEFNKQSTDPVTIDFNNHSITFHLAGEIFNGVDSRKDFLVMESGQLVLANGTLHGTDWPSLKMMGDYKDGQTADDVQKQTTLTCSNMNIDHFYLKGYAGYAGPNSPGNMHPEWRHLFVQKSVLEECTFDGISASIKDSLVHNASYIDYVDVGDTSYLCNLDFDGSILTADSSKNYPLTPSMKATFSDTLTINSLSVSFVPVWTMLFSWSEATSLLNGWWGDVTRSFSSSFMDYESYNGYYVSTDPIYLISDTPTKFIGTNNYGYSFATTAQGNVLASQDIPAMAKGVTQDQDGNPTSSADQYMFVPGDADITLEAPDFPDQAVNIALSYSAGGYTTQPATYTLKDQGKVDLIPVPAWTITGYDQEKRELQKQETTFDQLDVTCSTGDPNIDDRYEFIPTYSKSDDGTHISIHVKAVKMDDGQDYTVRFDANGGSGAPEKETVSFLKGAFQKPDSTQMTNQDEEFMGWYLDQEGKYSFDSYFGKTVNAPMITSLRKNHFLSDDSSTITLYAGWDDKDYTLTYDPNGGSWDDGSKDIKQEKTPKSEIQTIMTPPARIGYEFEYWKGSEFYPDDKYEGEGTRNQFGRPVDHTLTAQWTPNEYYIVYNLNNQNAYGSVDNMTVTVDTEIGRPVTRDLGTYDDEVFAGWYLDQECTEPFQDFGKVLDANLVSKLPFDLGNALMLYAAWAPGYTIRFDGNGGIGTVPADIGNLTLGSQINKPGIFELSKTNYTFTGWFLDKEGKVPFTYFGNTLNEDIITELKNKDALHDGNPVITVYAGWKAAPEPTPTPSATPSTSTNNNRGAVASTSHSGMFFPITSAQKFIPATGAAGENNN